MIQANINGERKTFETVLDFWKEIEERSKKENIQASYEDNGRVMQYACSCSKQEDTCSGVSENCDGSKKSDSGDAYSEFTGLVYGKDLKSFNESEFKKLVQNLKKFKSGTGDTVSSKTANEIIQKEKSRVSEATAAYDNEHAKIAQEIKDLSDKIKYMEDCIEKLEDKQDKIENSIEGLVCYDYYLNTIDTAVMNRNRGVKQITPEDMFKAFGLNKSTVDSIKSMVQALL